jgi:hypothetical protein
MGSTFTSWETWNSNRRLEDEQALEVTVREERATGRVR